MLGQVFYPLQAGRNVVQEAKRLTYAGVNEAQCFVGPKHVGALFSISKVIEMGEMIEKLFGILNPTGAHLRWIDLQLHHRRLRPRPDHGQLQGAQHRRNGAFLTEFLPISLL